MSDSIKHECGIAMLRLRKPMEYYIEKYGTWNYGLQKMYLMMEKQHNRGQDGAGIAGIKMNVEPGNRYIFRQRSNKANPIKEIFSRIYEDIDAFRKTHPEVLIILILSRKMCHLHVIFILVTCVTELMATTISTMFTL